MIPTNCRTEGALRSRRIDAPGAKPREARANPRHRNCGLSCDKFRQASAGFLAGTWPPLPTIGLGCHAAMAATPALAGFEVGYLSQDGVEHRAKTRLVSEAARKRAGAAS